MDNGVGASPLTPGEFEALYRASFQTLWCIAVGVLADRSQAEDVLQDAAMIALKKIDTFQRGTNFVAWFGRIVRFVALNALRKNTNAARPSDPLTIDSSLSHEPGCKASPVDDRGDLCIDQQAFDDHILEGLRSLSHTARACLLLRTVQEMTYQEIARALDIPEGTAMSHVHRSRRFLRARISESSRTSDDRL